MYTILLGAFYHAPKALFENLAFTCLIFCKSLHVSFSHIISIPHVAIGLNI
jgi:hypothetical protein